MNSVMLDKNGQRVQILAEKLEYVSFYFTNLKHISSSQKSNFRRLALREKLTLWTILHSFWFQTDVRQKCAKKILTHFMAVKNLRIRDRRLLPSQTEAVSWQPGNRGNPMTIQLGIKSDCISFISCISLTLPFVFLSAWQQWKSSSSDNTAEHQIKLLSVELYTLVWSPCHEATFRFLGNYDIFVLHHVWAHVTILININSEEHQRSTQRSWKGSWISLQDQFMFCGVISSPI